MLSKRSISIVIPNFNGRTLLERNLPSLIDALKNIPHEIIIVDDCSSDNSVDFVRQHYPDINVITNSVNRGFSTTCNKGITLAKMDLVCVTNTDVTFTQDYFTQVLPEFDDPHLFAVKGDIINYGINYDDIQNVDRTTRLYYKHGFLRFDTKNPLTQRHITRADDIDFVCLGCCFVCDRTTLQSLNGFDTIYSPFYWEDADLALRGLKTGKRLLYLPGARVYHQASSTIGKYRSNARRRLISNRNKFIFTWRHMNTGYQWLGHIGFTLFNLITRWIILDWKYYAALTMGLIRIATHNRK